MKTEKTRPVDTALGTGGRRMMGGAFKYDIL
jgi:hypothetical protein